MAQYVDGEGWKSIYPPGAEAQYHGLLAPMQRDEYLAVFAKYTERMLAITTAKNGDYADASDPFKNFREFGTRGFLVRMSDKWVRIKNLLWEPRETAVKDESVEDTLLDLANYCILLLCWRENEKRCGR